jgi:hypothetical protein
MNKAGQKQAFSNLKILKKTKKIQQDRIASYNMTQVVFKFHS